MRGNSFGRFLVITSFGESHGPALGAVVDGVPAGIELCVDHIAYALHRRRPGLSNLTSARQEEDIPEILSGVLNNRTLGTPIAVVVRNQDARSTEYSQHTYRTGHADSIWEEKYGIRDYRGGGRASGRETIARVIAGAIAERILPPELRILAYTLQIGEIATRAAFDDVTREQIDTYSTRCPDPVINEAMENELLRLKSIGDSAGGIVELRLDGVPIGLGEPVFHKTKSELAAAIMSIGAVSGVSLGEAFTEVLLPGSDFHLPVDGGTQGLAARSHGIQGGITTGERITMRIAVKPTSTIGEMAMQGRHDPCIVPRIIPVIEAMAALTLADLYLASRLDTAL